MILKSLPYLRPATVEEALRMKRDEPGAQFVAGGTDLFPRLEDGRAQARALVSLRAIPELQGVEERGAELWIGALTPLGDVLAEPLVQLRYAVLAQALARMASQEIRNVATLGGNLCNASPCADSAPPLLVLGARVRIQGLTGTRDVPLEELFVGPGETIMAPDELLSGILLAPPAPAARGVFLKQGRVHVDVALVTVALWLELEGERCLRARLAAGAVAPVPLRLEPVEALLEGNLLDPALLTRAQDLAARSVAPISDLRASEGHRRHLTGVLVRRSLEIALGRREMTT